MPDKTISQLEGERYTHIECECRNVNCRNWMAVPFKMIRARQPDLMLSAMTVADLAKKMHCGKCGNRDVAYKAWRQEDAPGFAKGIDCPIGRSGIL
jgi:hypothetical protein